MVPATIVYRVLAENFNEAIDLTKNQQPTSIKYKIPAKKDIKIYVYDAGTSIVRFVKNIIK